jgi:hypothetical protein
MSIEEKSKESKESNPVKSLKLDKYLPQDAESIRKSPIYNPILEATRWQRDNYLMGQKYADRRKEEREIRPDLLYMPRINWVQPDPTALGNIQLAQLGSGFIPSETVKKALLPIVIEQPRGNLYPPALPGLVGLIESQQGNMDALLKSSILDLLEQERLKKLVMTSTKGYIADSSPSKNTSQTPILDNANTANP